MPCARFLVSGHVQGVGYRAAARAEALHLGICGHACNQRDGRVEVIASGSEEALIRFEAWLRRGPAAARVNDVTREALPEQERVGFYTR